MRSKVIASLKGRKGLAFFEDGSANYVDSNNRLFGFDMYDQCCEDFGCELIWEEGKSVRPETFSLDAREVSFFDGVFFKGNIETEEETEYGESGGKVECPLVNASGEIVGKIVAHNYHNGYYSHNLEHNLTEDGSIVENYL